MAYDWRVYMEQCAGRPVPHLGTRFDAAGRFLPEQGNTVVAQVVPGSPTEAALVDLRDGLMALPHAGQFAFTAVPSYHMTVFEGVVETRRTASHWPEGIDPDTGIDRATFLMAQRLAGFAAPPAFAVRATGVTPFGLNLAGATPADDAAMRGWRDALATTLGLRTPGHDDYAFHTTLAYMMAPLPPEAIAPCHAALAGLARDFIARVPVLHLTRPAFCYFKDMNAFAPVVAL